MDKKLIDFLIKAKRSTYASAEGDSKKVLSDGSKEFSFSIGDFFYRDRYFGSDPFAGEEVVFSKNEAIWVMNYYGVILDKTMNEKEVYGFLKKALMNVPEDNPLRGLARFTLDGYVYSIDIKASGNSFMGHEKIYFKDKQIYELFLHGGLIA